MKVCDCSDYLPFDFSTGHRRIHLQRMIVDRVEESAFHFDCQLSDSVVSIAH